MWAWLCDFAEMGLCFVAGKEGITYLGNNLRRRRRHHRRVVLSSSITDTLLGSFIHCGYDLDLGKY